MTQLTVTIKDGVDSNFIRRIIENLKGVVKVSYANKAQKDNIVNYSDSTTLANDDSADEEVDEWINKMTRLSNSIDPSIVDMNDERTRYLMSK